MAQFIALMRRKTERFTEEEFAPLLEPEAERVRELYTAGVFRTTWGRKDTPGAVILLEAESVEDARTTLETLPLVQREMIEATLIPVGPYRGFAPRG
jgi:muconolactone delta-isomerase